MDRFGYSYIAYCGTYCNPVCFDEYKWNVKYAEYDARALKEAIKKKITRDEAKKILEEIYGLREELEAHANVCGAYDCQVQRSRRWYEFGKELLVRLGVEFKEDVCGCEKECPENIEYDKHPAEVVEDAICEKFPDVCIEFYDP